MNDSKIYLLKLDQGLRGCEISKIQGLFKTILQFSRTKSLGKILI